MAADRIAIDLGTAALDVRVLDLNPAADDGFNFSDCAAAAHTESGRRELYELLLASADAAPTAAERWVRSGGFLEGDVIGELDRRFLHISMRELEFCASLAESLVIAEIGQAAP